MMPAFLWMSFMLFASTSEANNTVMLTGDEREQYSDNVTMLLDSILHDYDMSIRPNFDHDEPTEVFIDISVRSMGPISELDMTYAMDCYFRQTWRDSRLLFSSHRATTLALGLSMLDKIWKPDTYFWNGLDSYVHMLTVPNKFVRLAHNGTVYFSSRLTIKANCPMYLAKYPLDSQRCPLIIGSFAYPAEDMIYQWRKGLVESVEVHKDVQMAQMLLRGTLLSNGTREARRGLYSTLGVDFLLERQSGYFLLNFYGPCFLIVVLSWVAFWINREATADRIALGVMSILTMTFLGLESRADLPRVTYPTALDIYFFLCYFFLLGTILEFALVHAFTKYGTADPELKYLEQERIDEIAKEEANHVAKLKWCGGYGAYDYPRFIMSHRRLQKWPSSPKRWWQNWLRKGKKADIFDTNVNSTSGIDRIARISFPIAFALANSVYWNSYLSISVGKQ